jgi:hypothetical protein
MSKQRSSPLKRCRKWRKGNGQAMITERTKITAPRNNGINEAERLELARLLIKAGYCVKLGSEDKNGRKTYYIEYWEER